MDNPFKPKVKPESGATSSPYGGSSYSPGMQQSYSPIVDGRTPPNHYQVSGFNNQLNNR